jgi:ParB family chromosome partitioning protein
VNARLALEQEWLLAEIEQRFGYGLEELARRFDRSSSWVSRRLALVELLPESVQQQVREGQITAHVAMKYLVPMARISLDDCQRMAAAFAGHAAAGTEGTGAGGRPRAAFCV